MSKTMAVGGVGLIAAAALLVSNTVSLVGQNPDQARIERLVQRVQASGRVRVIVGVAAAFTPEGELPDNSIAAQREGISLAQSQVISLVPPSLRQSVRRYDTIPYIALEVDAATLGTLRGSPSVTTIEEDLLVPVALAESVPLIGAPPAWAQGATGAGWTVAVLDTGVDKTHPFLAGKVVSEACYSTTVAGQSTTVCPGGVSSSTAPGSGVNCPYADCEHGTHVAGIATGKGSTFSGVAKDASLIAVQVFSFIPSTGSVGAYTSDIVSGLQRVYALRTALNIASVNMSLGGQRFFDAASCDAANPSTKAAIDQLRSANIATVIASGNNGYVDSMSSPGCISTAISVGSTDDGSLGTVANAVSFFSNSASFLSLLAPGRWINSSIPGGGFDNFEGTSMATPHVAGAWAVLRSAMPIALTVPQVLSAIQRTGLSIVDTRNGIAKPRVKVDFAMYLLHWGSASSRTPTVMTARDFDGDGKADISVYRSSTGEWFSLRSSNGSLLTAVWGAPSAKDRPVAADYDGDGKADIAVFRQTTGEWFIRRSSDLGLTAVGWGAPSDLPVPADYDGDGKTDIAVYRGSTGQWFVRRSSNGSLLQATWGAPSLGDLPVPGDYDGDGKADIAVYRGATGVWYINQSSNNALLQVNWGAPSLGDIPVVGDFDHDGKADFGVYRGNTGDWFVHLSSNNSLLQANWGAPSLADMPVPGDFDGDGKADIAVYRFLTGQWFIRRSSDLGLTQTTWGAGSVGDSVREY
jgi:subtilisin